MLVPSVHRTGSSIAAGDRSARRPRRATLLPMLWMLVRAIAFLLALAAPFLIALLAG